MCGTKKASETHHNEKDYVSVREFYRNRNVFITGCTGFVGQGLLEKLLRSCPEIGRVYIPIRAKRNEDSGQRYENFLNNEAYVHVSSLYAHIDQDYVDEMVVPTVWDHKHLIDMMDKSDLAKRTKEIVGVSPGTYFVTKKVAEYMTLLEGGSSPVAVVRLGKVSPALREPVPGWFYGYASYNMWMALVEKGLVNAIPGTPNHKEEFIPVDLCANTLINTAWYIGTNQANLQTTTGPFVVHAQSTSRNILTTEQFGRFVDDFRKENGRHRKICISPSRLQLVLKDAVPVLIQSFQDLLGGHSPKTLLFYIFILEKGIHQIQVHNNAKEYKNLNNIEEALSENDKKMFQLDIDYVDWEKYVRTWLSTLKEKREKRTTGRLSKL